MYLKKILTHKDFGRAPLEKLSQVEDTLRIVLPLAATIEELLIRKFAAQQHEMLTPSLENQRTLPMVGKERKVRGCEEKTSSKQFETDKKSFLEQYRQRQKLNNMNHETTQRTLKLAQELEEKGRQSASALQRCECRAKELIQDARTSHRRWSAPPWTGSKTPIDVDARASAARHKAETLARRGLKLTLRRWDPPWV
uniref:Uncharacterized protein n=1 Tax=Timema bartmani TaxID=61472 RepID=A0A7R9I7N3_9NEOP|nr:unnamed protein product [Timema bartmani]